MEHYHPTGKVQEVITDGSTINDVLWFYKWCKSCTSWCIIFAQREDKNFAIMILIQKLKCSIPLNIDLFQFCVYCHYFVLEINSNSIKFESNQFHWITIKYCNLNYYDSVFVSVINYGVSIICPCLMARNYEIPLVFVAYFAKYHFYTTNYYLMLLCLATNVKYNLINEHLKATSKY